MRAALIAILMLETFVGCSAAGKVMPSTIEPAPAPAPATRQEAEHVQAPSRRVETPAKETIDDGEELLGTIKRACERGDKGAVRDERALVEKSADTDLRLCLGRALVDTGDVIGAQSALSPLLGLANADGGHARELIATALERLGRWEEIVALYRTEKRVRDHRDRRHLGWALYQLKGYQAVEEVVFVRKPDARDAWYWLWWLVEFEKGVTADTEVLAHLVEELLDAPDREEVRRLRPIATQAYRKGRWLEAANKCRARQSSAENEVHALTMSRTAVAAAVRGDLRMWSLALGCAFKLAQSSTQPEETCQEIHQEQIDWSVLERLQGHSTLYPEFGACGESNPDIFQWLKQWRHTGKTKGAT